MEEKRGRGRPKRRTIIEGRVIPDAPVGASGEGEPKRKSRASWKPANIVEIPNEFKDPNKVYYAANTRRPGRVLQKIREGWEVDKDIVKKMMAAGYIPDLPATLQDGTPQDGTLRFRELIVLSTTKENAEAREEYYRNLDPIKNRDKQYKQEVGGRDYGDIEYGMTDK